MRIIVFGHQSGSNTPCSLCHKSAPSCTGYAVCGTPRAALAQVSSTHSLLANTNRGERRVHMRGLIRSNSAPVEPPFFLQSLGAGLASAEQFLSGSAGTRSTSASPDPSTYSQRAANDPSFFRIRQNNIERLRARRFEDVRESSLCFSTVGEKRRSSAGEVGRHGSRWVLPACHMARIHCQSSCMGASLSSHHHEQLCCCNADYCTMLRPRSYATRRASLAKSEWNSLTDIPSTVQSDGALGPGSLQNAKSLSEGNVDEIGDFLVLANSYFCCMPLALANHLLVRCSSYCDKCLPTASAGCRQYPANAVQTPGKRGLPPPLF